MNWLRRALSRVDELEQLEDDEFDQAHVAEIEQALLPVLEDEPVTDRAAHWRQRVSEAAGETADVRDVDAVLTGMRSRGFQPWQEGFDTYRGSDDWRAFEARSTAMLTLRREWPFAWTRGDYRQASFCVWLKLTVAEMTVRGA